MNMLKSLFGAGNNGAGAMTAQEAHELINSSTPPFIVDVREPQEYQAGHISGAKLIPLANSKRGWMNCPKTAKFYAYVHRAHAVAWRPNASHGRDTPSSICAVA